MNRNLHNAMIAQYATPKVSGDGLVSWNGGVKCVISSIKLYGATVQGGTPTPEVPIMPMCNDGVVVARGKNLWNDDSAIFNKNYWVRHDNAFISTKTSATYIYADFPLIVEEAYTLSAYFEEIEDDRSKVQIRTSDNVILAEAPSTSEAGRVSLTFVPKKSEIYRFCIGGHYTGKMTISRIQLEVGLSATDYTYWNGGQAQAPELWAIPGTDIRDEWDAQTGWGVRRCAVIDSYAGEQITTPYISSTGELSEGAMVVYGIPDTPFYTAPARLTEPNGPGQIIQISGSVLDCPIEAAYLTHS